MTIQKLTDSDLRTCVAGGTITQYEFVEMGSAGTVTDCDATADTPYGIAQEAASSGGSVLVAVTGISKLVASAAIEEGALVGTTSSATGVTVAPGTTDGAMARAMCVKPAAAANDVCSVDLSVQGGWLLLDNS